MGIAFKKNIFLLISIGAIPGALFRWQINDILIVNILGCLLLGFLNSSSISTKYKLILGVGFCGSITTFSGWVFHLYNLLNQGLYKLFIFHSVSIIFMGMFSIGLGHIFAKKIHA
mgnify:CR=1 FL=1|tara:strand:+ start:453 stop:797 length:345 start_codon:yes stop_codon:yes gene_type:complete